MEREELELLESIFGSTPKPISAPKPTRPVLETKPTVFVTSNDGTDVTVTIKSSECRVGRKEFATMVVTWKSSCSRLECALYGSYGYPTKNGRPTNKINGDNRKATFMESAKDLQRRLEMIGAWTPEIESAIQTHLKENGMLA